MDKARLRLLFVGTLCIGIGVGGLKYESSIIEFARRLDPSIGKIEPPEGERASEKMKSDDVLLKLLLEREAEYAATQPSLEKRYEEIKPIDQSFFIKKEENDGAEK